MEIRNLSALSTADIVQCLLSSFSNYFVPLPDSVAYWEERFHAARVDSRFSFGMFEGDRLVGFIINGIDQHEGKLTAFNSGTGVLPAYRGKGIVDDLYAHALPVFRQRGVEKCMLEVIQENERALKVYRRIGFKIKRNLTSWKGTLPEADSAYQLKRVDFQQIFEHGLYRPYLYSWDNRAEAVLLGEESRHTYLVTDDKENVKGYVTMGAGGQVVQLDVVEKESLSEVIHTLGKLSSEIKLVNVPQEREALINTLKSFGFKNTINQYEMEFFL